MSGAHRLQHVEVGVAGVDERRIVVEVSGQRLVEQVIAIKVRAVSQSACSHPSSAHIEARQRVLLSTQLAYTRIE